MGGIIEPKDIKIINLNNRKTNKPGEKWRLRDFGTITKNLTFMLFEYRKKKGKRKAAKVFKVIAFQIWQNTQTYSLKKLSKPQTS